MLEKLRKPERTRCQSCGCEIVRAVWMRIGFGTRGGKRVSGPPLHRCASCSATLWENGGLDRLERVNGDDPFAQIAGSA